MIDQFQRAYNYSGNEGNGYTFKGDSSGKLSCFPSGKGSALKGKNLLTLGANSFL